MHGFWGSQPALCPNSSRSPSSLGAAVTEDTATTSARKTGLFGDHGNGPNLWHQISHVCLFDNDCQQIVGCGQPSPAAPLPHPGTTQRQGAATPTQIIPSGWPNSEAVDTTAGRFTTLPSRPRYLPPQGPRYGNLHQILSLVATTFMIKTRQLPGSQCV